MALRWPMPGDPNYLDPSQFPQVGPDGQSMSPDLLRLGMGVMQGQGGGIDPSQLAMAAAANQGGGGGAPDVDPAQLMQMARMQGQPQSAATSGPSPDDMLAMKQQLDSLPKQAQAAPAQAKPPSFWDRLVQTDPRTGVSFADRVGRLGAGIQDAWDFNGSHNRVAQLNEAQLNAMKLRMEQQQMAMNLSLAQRFIGGRQGTGAGQVGAAAQQSQGGQSVAAGFSQPSQGQSAPVGPMAGQGAPGGQGEYTPDDLHSYAAASAAIKGDVAGALKAVDPDYQVTRDGIVFSPHDGKLHGRLPHYSDINGWNIDQSNPSNTGKFFPKPPVDGATPVVDAASGAFAGWHMPDGTVQAVRAVEQAKQDVKDRSTPVAIQDHGETRTMSAAAFANSSLSGNADTQAPGLGPQQGQPNPSQQGQPGQAPSASFDMGSYLKTTKQLESGARGMTAQNGQSTGTYQFHPQTFYSVLPNGNIHDPADQEKAAGMLAQTNAGKLQTMNVPVTGANVYIMHQQGDAGGPALLQAPADASAVAVLTPAYRGNANMARQAIVGNVEKPLQAQAANWTARQFVNYWQNRYNNAAGAQSQSQGGQQPQQQQAQSQPQAQQAPGFTSGRTQLVTRPDGTLLNVGPDGKATPVLTRDQQALPPEDQKRVDAIKDQARKMSRLATLGSQFIEMNRSQNTGGIHAYIGDLESPYNPQIGKMQSLTKEMIPLQREIGSGPIRMGEIQGPGGGIWGGDVPRVGSPGDTNQFMAKNWATYAKQLQDYSAFADNWAKSHPTLNGMDEAWTQRNGGHAVNMGPPPSGGQAGQAPAVIPHQTQGRAPGVYQTPKGPLRWTGQGWTRP